jgi:RNA polymerase sigma factor (sigma-70 family)
MIASVGKAERTAETEGPAVVRATVVEPAAVVAGEVSWLPEFVQAHRARLLTYARRRGFGADDALDAVQEAFLSFLKLPEARAIGRDSADSLKMLTVILRHTLQNQRRKRSRRDRLLPIPEPEALLTPSSEALILQAEELARVRGCLLLLNELQRRVVMLSLLEERPHQHVATLLGISVGYVRVLLHRAREHLRSCEQRYPNFAPVEG